MKHSWIDHREHTDIVFRAESRVLYPSTGPERETVTDIHHHHCSLWLRSGERIERTKYYPQKKLAFQMKSEEKSYERINNQLDGTRGWVVTAACFMAAFLTDGITFCFGLILFELIQVFDEPVEKVAWIPSFLLGIQLLSGISH